MTTSTTVATTTHTIADVMGRYQDVLGNLKVSPRLMEINQKLKTVFDDVFGELDIKEDGDVFQSVASMLMGMDDSAILGQSQIKEDVLDILPENENLVEDGIASIEETVRHLASEDLELAKDAFILARLVTNYMCNMEVAQ